MSIRNIVLGISMGLPGSLLTPPSLPAQSTQSALSGTVTDSVTGRAVSSASVQCVRDSTRQLFATPVDGHGFYIFAGLSAGRYTVTVRAPGYQSQQARALEVLVASRVDLSFRVRPLSDLWEAGQYRSWQMPQTRQAIGFYGPDVDTSRISVFDPNIGSTGLSSLQSGVSYAVDTTQLSNLPLSGRNVYQLLSFQPGVTSALTVNGQNSALFLLDGVSSPTGLGPEFVQEYRVSTGNFSPEFGRTTGFVANAVTRAGSNQFHGLVYFYINNEVLNANAFQSNSDGFPRQPYRYFHAGTWAGGPLQANKTFFSGGYEYFQSRTQDYPFDFQVPVLASFRNCPATAHGQALALLERYPPPPAPVPGGDPCEHLSGAYSFSVPIAIDRGFALARLDRLLRGGKDHLMVRGIVTRETDPDSIFSLYKDFISAQKVDATSVAFDGVEAISPHVTMELRSGWQHSTNDLPLSHPEVPTLTTATDGATTYTYGISLPGVIDSVSAQRNKQNEWEIEDNLTITHSRHLMSFGGGAYVNYSTSLNAYLRSGEYQFASLQNFGQDLADALHLTVSRASLFHTGALTQPDYTSSGRRVDFFGFFQDSFRATRRLTLNSGVRYDSFGLPGQSGGQDAHIQPGPGSSIQDSIRSATFVFGLACCPPPYGADRRAWAPRLALSFDLTGSGKHVLRGAYGLLYDPTPLIFNSGNNLEVVTFYPPTGYLNVNYSNSLLSQIPYSAVAPIPDLPQPLLISPMLKAPTVQSWFAGIQDSLPMNVAVEVNYTGSASNNLITTDQVNRTNTTNLDSSRLNPSLPFDLSYASNAGYSRYHAGTALVRYRSHVTLMQIAYTLSHSIDNNSGIFTRQFDRQLDRGSSDFDQRQNLVIYSILQPPALGSSRAMRTATGGWTIGSLAGFRSGFPFTVYADTVPGIQPCPGSSLGEDPVLYQNRASLIPGQAPIFSQRVAVPGGVQIVNPQAFCLPAADSPGDLGRNVFAGPGFWNVDLSVGKFFGLKWLGEAGKLQMRADYYNAMNHANLGDPIVSNTGYSVFGQAFYGKSAAPPGTVSVVPLDEAPRRIELQVRLSF